ncbi:uncharacterized protein LACBIDRAFT_312765 [Laccaria bicolor S238N-H82]|uniref:Predicted protein n=1 Tax=Laccaria bicolor (strain S238N-H82 / ATCC MYA-4686) TaxID=486041 RepID=B0DWM7_LACBS|nr:uncharacterized protein LACBIDRAFT_312765 [Laccaria bicolor S238N-H82]EDR00963.1 predicted protein [Laccaria bicolor S238N-H82]|eukprot:XP_001888358.1 predicted protein [Laccaria bicolor S238N-H82]
MVSRIDPNSSKKGEAGLLLRCFVLPSDDPESCSFVVRIDRNHYISELKQAIKTLAAPRLDNVFAPSLLLWKCAIPMGQEIIESVRLDGTDRSLDRITGDCRLSKLWSEELPSNTFHILVQAPEESPGPRSNLKIHEGCSNLSDESHITFSVGEAGLLSTNTRSSSNNTKLPRSPGSSRVIKPRLLHASEGDRQDKIMCLLYDALWKKGEQAWTKISRIIKEHVPDSAVALGEAEGRDLDPPKEAQVTIVDLTSLLKWTMEDANLDVLTPIFLARGEYTELDNFLESNDNHVLLLGQPGIGKTIYLTYCLLRRLIAGLPTIFVKTSDIRYIFLDSGVYWIPCNSFNMSEDSPFTDRLDNTLVLFDLNEEQSTPERFYDWRVLVSSSPQSARYKEWVKHRGAEYWVMRTWSWEEISFARELPPTKIH